MLEHQQQHHAIDYIEINVDDLARAKQFYHNAFGWEFNEYGDGYAGIRCGDGEMGGLRLMDTVAPGGPLIILYSQDLEASRAAVAEAGGDITAEPFTFPGGRRFQFRDPCGTELGVWSDQKPDKG